MERCHRSRPASESAQPSTAKIQPPAFGTSQVEQPQQPPIFHDFSHVDLFSHAPQRAPIQMKFTAGEPNDRYEQEADRAIAEPTTTHAPPDTPPSTNHPSQPNPAASSGRSLHDFSHVDLFSHAPQRAPIQMKLTVGAPNDRYEQEADRVAEQVMSMAPPTTPQVQRQSEEDKIQTKPLIETITPLIQRQEEEEPIQAKCEACEAEEPIQRVLWRASLASDVPTQAQPDLESRLNASQGGGSALPGEVRSFMEPRFGADFSGVRVHTGSEAVQMNQDLGAQAFTYGSHIYYGEDNIPAKDKLTGHELTHVVQQTGNLQMQQRDRSMHITTETFAQAPSGAPNTRRTIGVGESVTFTANRSAIWEAPGIAISGPDSPRRSTLAFFERPGNYTVTAGIPQSEVRASVQIQVVAPSIRVRKLEDIQIPLSEGIGAYMRLEFRLTPLEVSYSSLEFREENCAPTSLWGYLENHPELANQHEANPAWARINSLNTWELIDNARFDLNPSNLPWPLTPGGFNWRIPDSYRIGSTVYPFANPMTQTFQMNPSRERPPFAGSITIWKGGETVRRDYP